MSNLRSSSKSERFAVAYVKWESVFEGDVLTCRCEHCRLLLADGEASGFPILRKDESWVQTKGNGRKLRHEVEDGDGDVHLLVSSDEDVVAEVQTRPGFVSWAPSAANYFSLDSEDQDSDSEESSDEEDLNSEASDEGEQEIKDEQEIEMESKTETIKDVKFAREGKKIILPENMKTQEAITWLTRKLKEDETDIAVNHVFDAYPLEGAYAMVCALRDEFGYVSLDATPSFFGPRPPVMVGVEIEPGKTVQVPWGRMSFPGVEGYVETGHKVERDKSVKFVLAGVVKRKDEVTVNKIFELIINYCKTQSLFKGKAIRVQFPDPDDEGPFSIDPGYMPKILDVSKVQEKDLIFPAEIDEVVKTTLFAPIEHTAACRKLRIPLKRGVLLEGPYGTGKTMAAYVTAKKCVENGWTFLYVEKSSDLNQAIALAKHYQPACIFAEDIDRAIEGEKRTEEIDDILNTIDGIDAKDHDIMVILTTNHVSNINRAMLRPGRLDAIIPVRPPDAEAAIRLVRLYARGLLAEGEDLTQVGVKLDGQIPAAIREVVERSKLSAIRHTTDKKLCIRAADLIIAANGMAAQIELLKPEQEDNRSQQERAADILGKHLAGAIRNAGSNGVSTHAASLAASAAAASTVTKTPTL